MNNAEKIAKKRAEMKEIGLDAIIDGDNVESSIEGIMPNISIGQVGFQDLPYIAQKVDVDLDGDQVQVLPLNDGENNFYYAVVKHKTTRTHYPKLKLGFHI